MKRKLIPLILALVCAVACAFGLAACNNGDNGGGDGGDKYMTGIVIVDSNGAEHNDSYDMGSIVYGSIPDFNSVNLYIKYSDGSKDLLGDGANVSETWYHGSDELALPPAACDLGSYSINYTYTDTNGGRYVISVDFAVTTSATATPYALTCTTSWKYPAEPTTTVTKGGEEVNDSYNLYTVTAQEYNEIKNAADFKEQLEAKREWYDATTTKPGSYYLYADCGGYNSDFKIVTVQKGDVTPANLEGSNGSFNYLDKVTIGKIKLSEVQINNLSGDWKNSKGDNLSGSLKWQNPDEEVDSTNNGETRRVKWVPSEDYVDCYNECFVTDPIPLNITKGGLDKPVFYYGNNSIFWDGDSHDIKLYSESSGFSSFISSVDVTYNGNPITLQEDGVLGTESEIGYYTCEFKLKDEVNYYWFGEGYEDTGDVAKKVLTFQIRKVESWATLEREYYIDENLQVKIKLNSGTVNDGSNNISPYKDGTLQAEILETYQSSGGDTIESSIDATAEVVNEDGDDWIVITVKEFKVEHLNLFGYVIIKITAQSGDSHYADIYSVREDLCIWKYDFESVICPITKDAVIEKPIGTTVSELYTEYGLENKLGKWVLYLKYTSNHDWAEAPMDLELPEGEYSFKAVYQSDFVQYADDVEEVEFTVKGVQN